MIMFLSIRTLLSRLRSLFSGQRLDREFDDEVGSHLALLTEENMQRGMTPDQARYAALRSFGSVAQVHESNREHRGVHHAETLLQDVRYALRTLRKNPGFAAVVILTLALGIGANAAIFSFVNAVLLKPLPYPHPEQIVSVWEKAPQFAYNPISTLNFLDWQRQNHCFQFFSAVARDTATLTGSGRPEELNVQKVSASYFKVLGVVAALGRTFSDGEDEVGKDREVVLSNRIWQSRFGGERKVIGREITLDAKNYTIIGVLPANSEFDRSWGAMWLPLAFTPANMTRNYHWLYAIGRLEPGVTLEQARGQMDAIGARIAGLYPDSNKGMGVTVDPYIDQVVQPELRRSLWVLLAAVGAVLLIGCANVASLILVRGTAREHEISIRSALGARRLRLIRQLLTESILLGILGGAAGLALGNAFMYGMKLWFPTDMLPPQADVRMDYGVLLFTMVIGILTGILCGLAPALSGTRPDLARSLNERGTTAGRTRNRMRKALVAVEVALSFVLLAGASLLIQSFNRLASLNTGVDTTHVLAMDLPTPLTEFTNSTTMTNYLKEVTEKVRSLPGVRDAAITDAPPMKGFANGAPFLIEGQEDVPYSRRPVSGFKVIGPGYFETVGMRLLKGRSLDENDVAGGVPVTVINETMAKTYFKGEDPIGKRILIRQLVFGKTGRGPDVPWQVVGVVKDERVGGKIFSLAEDVPVIYVTFYQSPGIRNSLVVRAAMDPLLLSGTIEQAIWKVNSNQAVANIQTLEEIKSESVAPARLRTVLLAIFAGIALALAAVGIYGVVSYSVAQRLHEMAIRLALGASSGSLLKLVMGKTMLIVLVGLGLGGAAAFGLTRVLASLLYETSPTDGVTWAVAGALLAAVALLACYFPARRATKVDPLTVLRFE